MVVNDDDNGEDLEVAYQHLQTTPGRDDYKLVFKCIDESETCEIERYIRKCDCTNKESQKDI